MQYLIVIIIQQFVFVLVILFLLYRLEKFLRDIFLLFKAKDFYEAKDVLRPEKEEEEKPEEKYYHLEEFDPEKVLDLLNKVERKEE